ncbi:hypothetical protein PMAYCL1PPCAC_03233, partial [Pristionchus mayeri]
MCKTINKNHGDRVLDMIGARLAISTVTSSGRGRTQYGQSSYSMVFATVSNSIKRACRVDESARFLNLQSSSREKRVMIMSARNESGARSASIFESIASSDKNMRTTLHTSPFSSRIFSSVASSPPFHGRRVDGAAAAAADAPSSLAFLAGGACDSPSLSSMTSLSSSSSSS